MPLSPPDPRKYLPKNADPEHRSRRKEIEKSVGSFGWEAPVLLGMLGLGLAWNIEHQVHKHEEAIEKKEEELRKKEERERRRHERYNHQRSSDPRRESATTIMGKSTDGHISDRGSQHSDSVGESARSARSGSRDPRSSQLESRRLRNQSVDYDRISGPRGYIEPSRPEKRYTERSNDRYDERYYDRRDRIPQGRGRRDSL